MSDQEIRSLPWWEREKLLTEKDKEAINRAKDTRWEDIDTNSAETEAGKVEIEFIQSRKRHRDEWQAGIL